MALLPLVSVCIPSFNHRQYIGPCIESILGQAYENVELVISDDCSSDGTWEVVEAYRQKHPSVIKATRNSSNLGVTENCNAMLRLCRGDYVAFLGDDDLMLPGKLAAQAAALSRDANTIMVYHDVEVFRSFDGSLIRYWNRDNRMGRPVEGAADVVARAMVERGMAFSAIQSVMIRRSAIPGRCFDARVPVASDWLFLVDLLMQAPMGSRVTYLPSVLSRYRRHDSNVTGNGLSYAADGYVTLGIIEASYPALARSVQRGLAGLRYSLGAQLIQAGRHHEGRAVLASSLRTGWVSAGVLYWLVASRFPVMLRFRSGLGPGR